MKTNNVLAGIIRPHPIKVAEPLHRVPPRPERLRGPDYMDNFDSNTLFYDVFRLGQQVMAVGPPLFNLADPLRRARVGIDDHPVESIQIVPMDRMHRTYFPWTEQDPACEIRLDLDGVVLEGSIGRDLADLFSHRRALMTLSLDNKLAWIHDWISWHVRAHGTDAVLFYDNGSTEYDLDTLLDTISAVPGVAVAVVVDWSFRYGPQGVGPADWWDSDYAQYSAIEHARWRFLRQAAGFLNADVDELVYDASSRSVYDRARRSLSGFISYPGTWVHRGDELASSLSSPRHSQCIYIDPREAHCPLKWCAIPELIPETAQLQVHTINRGLNSRSRYLGYWHARPISTSWKENRHDPTLRSESLLVNPEFKRMAARYLFDGSASTSRALRTSVAGASPSEWQLSGAEIATKRTFHKVWGWYKKLHSQSVHQD
jgi:hypothetical protein